MSGLFHVVSKNKTDKKPGLGLRNKSELHKIRQTCFIFSCLAYSVSISQTGISQTGHFYVSDLFHGPSLSGLIHTQLRKEVSGLFQGQMSGLFQGPVCLSHVSRFFFQIPAAIFDARTKTQINMILQNCQTKLKITKFLDLLWFNLYWEITNKRERAENDCCVICFKNQKYVRRVGCWRVMTWEAVTRTNLFSMQHSVACLVYAKYYGNLSSLAGVGANVKQIATRCKFIHSAQWE